MTLSTTTSRIAHAANGATTWFAYPFKIWAASDLKVSLRDNATLDDTPQALVSDYTLNVASYPGAGSVVFITPPPATKTVVIEREVPETQDLDLVASGSFAAENVETQLDKIVAQVQQLRRQINDWPAAQSASTYNVTDFGAKCDGITEDHLAVQAAIDAAATTGGTVQFPAGTCLIGETLTVYSGVRLAGVHMNCTILKAKVDLNVPVIRSANYLMLVGTNKWLTSDGVIHGFEMQDLQIDGNRAHQSGSPNGVELYAKRLTLRHVLIRDCKAIGLVTETGAASGQANWQDLPEGSIGPLFIRNCGSHGWQMRGPHDAVVPQVGINECSGDGLRIEAGAEYNGTCDIGFAHIYANKGFGVYGGAPFKVRHLITESNDKEGLYLDANHVHIGMLETYSNCKVTGTFEVVLSANAASAIITSANIRNLFANTKGGIQLAADYCRVSARVDGSSVSSGGIGVEVLGGADYNLVDASIAGFTGTNGTGLKSNSGGVGSYNQINATIANCKTLWNNGSGGNYGGYRIRGRVESGQSFFVGSGPPGFDAVERWDICVEDQSGTRYLSEVRKTSGATFDLNTTTEQSISVSIAEIGWAGTIENEDVQFCWVSATTNATFQLQYLRLVDITGSVGSQVANFRLKMAVAAGIAATANILVQCRI
jgi:hypothetical protein